MTVRERGRVRALAALIVGSVVLCALLPGALAQQNPAAVKEAEERYNNGKALYRDGNFQGALAEFKQANELAPSPLTLFNIGQIQFVLNDYVSALGTFEQYLADPGADPKKKDQVNGDVTLRGRVSQIAVTTAEGAEVYVNGELVGTAPLARSVAVNMGEVRLRVSKGSRTRAVTLALAGGITKQVSLGLPDERAPPTPPSGGGEARSAKSVSRGTIACWVATAAVGLAGGVLGGLALGAGKDLKALREKPGATREQLDAAGAKATGLAVGGDVALATALAVAGVSIGLTVSDLRKGGDHKPTTSLRVARSGIWLTGSF